MCGSYEGDCQNRSNLVNIGAIPTGFPALASVLTPLGKAFGNLGDAAQHVGLMVRNILQYYRLDPALRHRSIQRWNVPLRWPLYVLLALIAVSGVAVGRFARRRDQRRALPEGRST